MRQKTQTADDAKLRTALENMRYKDCTEEDIAFLMSRVAGDPPDHPSLRDGRFRNVSIITAWNSQKDRINELGAQRFARDNKCELVEFFSEDKWAVTDGTPSPKAGPKKKQMSLHESQSISKSDQEILWSLSPHTSDHIAARLDLCLGMPIMIRNNDATELCITKGQEGKVVGWQSGIGTQGQRVLQTLFVSLVNPPTSVQIEGLPPDVVPISASTHTIPVRLHDDTVKHVQREQVNVLINFAMTDYASQGKTRPYNVVDLEHCANHQSYYTCLSRSASAEGTIIMQHFDKRKITGGASGWLRQEFRMLELLDEITLLRYEGRLPASIDGHRRNTLVTLYQQWKGANHVPSRVPSKLEWTESDPLEVDNSLNQTEWELVDRKKFKEDKRIADLNKFVPAIGTKPIVVDTADSCKRKADDYLSAPESSKRARVSNIPAHINEFLGLKWDSVNYSCAYDSLFTVLFHIWLENPHRWNNHMKNFSLFLTQLVKGFQQVYQNIGTFEAARDKVRMNLHKLSSIRYPMGHIGASVSDLAHTMLGTERDLAAWIRCHNCGGKVPTMRKVGHAYTPVVTQPTSVSEWLLARWKTSDPGLPCSTCNTLVSGQWQCDSPPKLLILDLYNQPMDICHTITVKGNKVNTKLHLKGVVYYKDAHFTSIVVDRVGMARFHDGMKSQMLDSTGTTLRDSNLSVKHGGSACLVIYSRLL
ncbi:hypothetical protein BJ138DRAFT_1019599 [Hygrophoropsis aurantiaca]|uniref:Uncharacterized protein n=1 Tax=Hygrophoropsis aurantiaca TaxID=72124 RepID=A0ACB7ZSC1_9AGAM|nr:hypothetical protein BJ138DRAFT_1019599 [Hygrophoropsis aurantiaca]